MWECMGYSVRRWIPSHRWSWCWVNFTLILKPSFRLRSPRRQSVGTRKSPWERIPWPNLCPRFPKKAGLSQVNTAHCVRASTITSLHRARVDAKQICAITKHKNEQSLTSYIKDSSGSQKRTCSNILSRPFLSRETSDVNTACGSSMAGGEVHVSSAALSQTPSVQPIMPNCQFTNCTINFNF